MGATIAQITQFGHSKEEGGWDIYGDKASDAFVGDHGNVMQSGTDCALSQSTRDAIGAIDKKPNQWITVDFTNGFFYVKRIGDTAPEANKRCDFLNYYAFDEQMDKAGDYAIVTLLPDSSFLIPIPAHIPSTPVLPMLASKT
jgi:hypothetical protein